MKSEEQFCRGNSEFSLNRGDFHRFKFRVYCLPNDMLYEIEVGWNTWKTPSFTSKKTANSFLPKHNSDYKHDAYAFIPTPIYPLYNENKIKK